MNKKACSYTNIGGSALIEGVMMRGNDKLAIALRRNDGTIQLKVEPTEKVNGWYNKVPIIRGVVNFVRSMMLSYKCLMYSADISMEGLETPEEPSKIDKFLNKLLGKTGMAIFGTIAMVLGLALSLFLFMYLPALFTGWAMSWAHPVLKAVVEGAIKILVFLGYLMLVSLMPDMRRVFQYHGGEHKSIFCYEAEQELNPENAMRSKRFHPRCGTSFMFFTLLISIVVAMFLPWGNRLVRTAIKICFVPLVMGLAYEFIRYAGKHDNLLTRIFSAPGLWFQRITTKEPDEKQLAVALCALKGVLNDYPMNQEIIVDEDGNYLKDKESEETCEQN
ncbi:MAG: DUF1385 domain-containing protein [Clostridia bacterium]|nr:DUF1385 domain-containing protein [Clostridia bacterium]